MTMGLGVMTDLVALLWQHPLLCGLVLVLFTPPFFPILKFFSPLLISTALFMVALFTMGGQQTTTSASITSQQEESWEFRRAADVKVWEDKSVFTTRIRKGDGSSWMDWSRTVIESGYAWVETKLQNENWKGSALNDENVSILQEATWAPTPKARDDNPSSSSAGEDINAPTDDTNTHVPAAISPSLLFKVDSELKAELVANAKRACDMDDLGEDARGLVDGVADTPTQVQNLKHANSVHHEPLGTLEIRSKTAIGVIDSPSTDLDDSSDLELSKRFVRRNSTNARSGLSVTSESDLDTPVALMMLSNSGKLKQIETLGDLIEEKELHHELKRGHEGLLQATTAEQVDVVMEKLEGFTHSPEHEKTIVVTKALNLAPLNPGSPLFKQGKVERMAVGKEVVLKKSSFSGDDSSSGEEELSDSDSDSEFEIFPSVDPAKMKLHPPVKLDILELEKKLGTSLSRAATPPKGEITEVQ